MNKTRSSLIILALLCITLLSTIGILPVSAAGSVSDQNYEKYKAVRDELNAEMEQCIPSPDDVECRLDDMVLREAINSFLQTLDDEKRNIFVRRYWFLDSIASISKRFNCSESKVKTTLFRCRNQLREHLETEGYIL